MMRVSQKQTKAHKKLEAYEAARAELQYRQEKAAYEERMNNEKKERHSRGEYAFGERYGLLLAGSIVFVMGLFFLIVSAGAPVSIISLLIGAALGVTGYFKMKKVNSEVAKIREKLENTPAPVAPKIVCSHCGAVTKVGAACDYCGCWPED